MLLCSFQFISTVNIRTLSSPWLMFFNALSICIFVTFCPLKHVFFSNDGVNFRKPTRTFNPLIIDERFLRLLALLLLLSPSTSLSYTTSAIAFTCSCVTILFPCLSVVLPFSSTILPSKLFATNSYIISSLMSFGKCLRTFSTMTTPLHSERRMSLCDKRLLKDCVCDDI